jgi:uncharacterized membrane protein
MSDEVSTVPATTNPGRSAEEMAGLKNVTMAVYILQALSFLWGISAIVGLIINYVKREDVRGTVYESHFDWQIRTFWWGLLWSVIGFVLIFALGLGLIIMFVAWIWTIYRVVKGWLKLNEGKPVQPA